MSNLYEKLSQLKDILQQNDISFNVFLQLTAIDLNTNVLKIQDYTKFCDNRSDKSIIYRNFTRLVKSGLGCFEFDVKTGQKLFKINTKGIELLKTIDNLLLQD